MASDLYTKFMLTIVAACLALLVAQGFGLGAPAAEEPASASALASEIERYRFVPVGMAGLLLRLDRQTGETWSMPLRGETRVWTPIGEGEAGEAQAPQAEVPEASDASDS